MLKLIHDQHGRVAILTPHQIVPASEWLVMQSKKPRATGTWFTAYPLTGGAISVQQGTFTVLCDVTQEHIDEAVDGHGFNPAAESILRLWNDHK